MTHRGPFQPLPFCDSVKTRLCHWFVRESMGLVTCSSSGLPAEPQACPRRRGHGVGTCLGSVTRSMHVYCSWQGRTRCACSRLR